MIVPPRIKIKFLAVFILGVGGTIKPLIERRYCF
nr:MAG TPA: hypothetical protein [Caudoviricetes sp.]